LITDSFKTVSWWAAKDVLSGL